MEAEERADGVRDTAEDATPTALDAPDPRAAPSDADGRADPHDRCRHHPNRAAVARCSACGDPVCLSCAVPVRGRVLGPGCVAEELGDPALTMPPEPDVSVPGAGWALAGALLALLATVGPWTRAGSGARLFGAWVPSVRWSTIAALASVVLIVVAWWFRASGSRVARALVIASGLVVVLASALAIAFPPIFQVASGGPWTAAVGGRGRRRRRDREPREGTPSDAGCLTPASGASWIRGEGVRSRDRAGSERSGGWRVRARPASTCPRCRRPTRCWPEAASCS